MSDNKCAWCGEYIQGKPVMDASALMTGRVYCSKKCQLQGEAQYGAEAEARDEEMREAGFSESTIWISKILKTPLGKILAPFFAFYFLFKFLFWITKKLIRLVLWCIKTPIKIAWYLFANKWAWTFCTLGVSWVVYRWLKWLYERKKNTAEEVADAQ